MEDIIRFIKKLFGKYEPGYEYWVYLKDIKVPTYYKRSWIRDWKWKHKVNYWMKTGKFESPIILHKDFSLADGYSSVKIAQLKKIEKVPVYFMD